MFSETELVGSCQAELDTEIKFSIASVEYDGAELMLFKIKKSEDEKDNSRLTFCALKTLRTLKKQGKIQFFVTDGDISEGGTEVSYLLNKYPDKLALKYEGYSLVFVKL